MKCAYFSDYCEGVEPPDKINSREKIDTVATNAIHTTKPCTEVILTTVINVKVEVIKVADTQARDTTAVHTKLADIKTANHSHLQVKDPQSLHLRQELRQLFAMSTGKTPLRCRSHRIARAEMRSQHRDTWTPSLPIWMREIAQGRVTATIDTQRRLPNL